MKVIKLLHPPLHKEKEDLQCGTAKEEKNFNRGGGLVDWI
jgi:hypothetical protein